MAGAADWVAEQRRLKQEAAREAIADAERQKSEQKEASRAAREFNSNLDNTQRAFRNAEPITARTAKGFERLGSLIGGLGVAAAGFGLAGPPGAIAGGIAGGLFGGGTAGMASGIAGSASPNGLQSVDKAFEILAGTIGGLVQPAFVLMGGLAMMGADSLRAWIKEHKAWIISTWAEAVVKATTAVVEFGEWLGKFPQRVKDWSEGNPRAGDVFGSKKGGFDDWLATLTGSKLTARGAFLAGREDWQTFGVRAGGAQGADKNFPQMRGRQFGAQGNDPNFPQMKADQAPLAPGAVEFIGKLADKMELIARDIATSVGKPTLSDPASKWKEVALAISQSEMENRKLAMHQEGLSLLRDVIRAIREIGNPAKGLPVGGFRLVGP